GVPDQPLDDWVDRDERIAIVAANGVAIDLEALGRVVTMSRSDELDERTRRTEHRIGERGLQLSQRGHLRAPSSAALCRPRRANRRAAECPCPTRSKWDAGRAWRVQLSTSATPHRSPGGCACRSDNPRPPRS